MPTIEVEKRLRGVEDRLLGVEKHLELDAGTRHEIFDNLRLSIESLNSRMNMFLGLFVSTVVALILGSYFLMTDVAELGSDIQQLGERVAQQQRRLEEKVERATEAAEQAQEQSDAR